MNKGTKSDLHENSKSELKVWQIESLRVTVFHVSMVERELTVWDELIKESPETRTSYPKQGFHRDEGAFENGKLIVETHPNRIDWLYAADTDKIEEGLPIIGLFPGAAENFCKLMHQWLKICPPIKRLAFGAILLQRVEDREEGYRQISEYLPTVDVDLDPIGPSDFLYQINRPRLSKSWSENLQINRLSTWSVSSIWRQGLNVEFSNREPVTPTHPRDTISACRLALDVNTSQEFSGELPKNVLSDLFDELVILAKEIADKGDIK
ncbi:MAG: hypothetical protein JRI95_03245 [Deltaproteobacteria bacterium]|nr:hypothetical protein [Deltaproteobacteria bacterium]